MMLFPIATAFMSGSVYADDPDKLQYDAAMDAITEGNYYLLTRVNGVKYFVTAQGELTNVSDLACLFSISKETGGALYNVGILIDPGTGSHFSNTTLTNNKANLHPNLDTEGNPIAGAKSFRLDASNNRKDWERQVFFMNDKGKFAIRSCNTAFGTSSWTDAGRAFWTYEVNEAGKPLYDDDSGCLIPCYSYEPAYIWTLATDTVDRAEAKMLVITATDGTQTKYLLSDMPRVRIEKPYLVIEADGAMVSLPLERLQHMHYEKATDDATAIEEIVVADEKTGSCEHIDFSNLPADANVSIYTTDGKLLYNLRPTQGKTLSLPLGSLQSGIYLVKVNDVTYKIQKP